MAFRPKRKYPDFARLKTTLAQIKTHEDNALYQTIQEIIERLIQLQSVSEDEINGKLSDADAIKKFATKFGTFLTKNDDTALLPNSIQLLAGVGISFDDSVPNKRTINATGGGAGPSNHYDAPLSDGNLVEAQLIYAAGECVIVQVPV